MARLLPRAQQDRSLKRRLHGSDTSGSKATPRRCGRNCSESALRARIRVQSCCDPYVSSMPLQHKQNTIGPADGQWVAFLRPGDDASHAYAEPPPKTDALPPAERKGVNDSM